MYSFRGSIPTIFRRTPNAAESAEERSFQTSPSDPKEIPILFQILGGSKVHGKSPGGHEQMGLSENVGLIFPMK